MQFTYLNGVATVEQAMKQIVMAWSGDPNNNPLVKTVLEAQIERTVEEGLLEIRSILTGELATLFDVESVAFDWNQAIEKCIQVVEGTLP